MSNSVNLSLDVAKTGIQNPLIKVRQGDGGFETLHTTVTANGEPMDLQGWTITFMGTTAGNHKIVDGNVKLVEAPNGIFDYTPSKAWGMDIGDFKIAYFQFIKGDGTASSANFRVSVIEAVDLTQEEAKDYISVVDASIKEVREHLESSLASVTQSIAATSSTASSLSVQVSSAVNQVNSATSNATSVASSTVDKVNSVASSAVSYISVNDANLVHNTGTETISGDKTFTGKVTSTQPIDGALSTLNATFTDFNDVARNMVKYSGSWVVDSQSIANSPLANYYTAIITPGFTGGTDGYIELVPFSGGLSKKYIAVVSSGTLSAWKSFAFDDDVAHKTGNETIAGDKTFTGKVTFSGSFDTQTVTNNGVTMTFKKFGNVVTVIGSGNYTGGDVNAFTKISDGVVPSGYLPAGIALVNANWGANVGQMGFNSSGAWLHRGPSALSKSWVVITGSWSV
nr:virion structural protein [Caudoviricetes sp.]CAI9750985.1 virion structural protein [Caudoviricetes sp.]